MSGLTADGTWNLATAVQLHVNACIAAHKGNMSASARALGLDRRTLYRMVKRYAATAVVREARASKGT